MRLRRLPIRHRSAGDDFLRQGICSIYRPVADETPLPQGQRVLSRADWDALFTLSHTDPRRASDAYTRHYLATNGQIYGPIPTNWRTITTATTPHSIGACRRRTPVRR